MVTSAAAASSARVPLASTIIRSSSAISRALLAAAGARVAQAEEVAEMLGSPAAESSPLQEARALRAP